MHHPRIARFRDTASLRAHLATIAAPVPLDDAPLAAAESPLAEPLVLGGRTAGNRWCIHPMEGWDATPEGEPSEMLLRRWRRFGASGAKLIWGGEAVAVVPEGRANPRQLTAPACGAEGFARLLAAVRDAHRERFGDDDLVVALQLTHSGRFSHPAPTGRRPRIAFRNPWTDGRVGIVDDAAVVRDEELPPLVDAYVRAARDAAAAGFDMVDVKACHGYLVHEFLAARRRPGPYGGDLAGRSRLLREIVTAVRAACPGLLVGVRLSLFDTPPWERSGDTAAPVAVEGAYDCGFGVDPSDPSRGDLAEPIAVVRMLHDLGVAAVNATAGSPYTTPHLLRPAACPPSDGYPPPEDPLCGVWRQVDAVRQVKAAVPEMPLVGSAYTYLQEYLPHAAQAIVRLGWVDAVGLGRMVLSYPELPADVLAGRPLARDRICRTFSDCTTAPRNGLPSGCYPLDEAYKRREPEASRLAEVKAAARR